MVVTEVCEGCVTLRMLEEEEKQYRFEAASIYVLKELPTSQDADPTDAEAQQHMDQDFLKVAVISQRLAVSKSLW